MGYKHIQIKKKLVMTKNAEENITDTQFLKMQKKA